MAIRLPFLAVLFAFALAGCGEREDGPIAVSAIGAPPQLVNPNLQPMDVASAILMETTAQGLVRFDAAGEIEPALAQSWIVSDDGLRYTFRLRRAQWGNGEPVTAQQAVARLRAALSRASRNRLKPVLGAIEDVVAMTDSVLEISLRGPRPNFLQLLAQPDLAIVLNGQGAGPYRLAEAGPAGVRLRLPRGEEESGPEIPDILLRGESAALAVARFAAGESEIVLGGTAGNLPMARAADLPAARLVFDPTNGLFGLGFTGSEGPIADPAIRRALSMAIDRDAIAAALNVPRLASRTGLVPPGVSELPAPSQPDWATATLQTRRELAGRAIAELAPEARSRLRVAMPDGPGYRLIFAYLRRDWRLIGVEAERVAATAPADLRFIDEVAPANLASWYLRHFTCDVSPICDPAADQALLAARLAPRPRQRNAEFAAADRILAELIPFIPLTAPVRWSLVSPRLTGFRANMFARHPAGELIQEPQ